MENEIELARRGEGPGITRMRAFSSMRPRRRDELVENRKYTEHVLRVFMEYCCWKSLAPLALSTHVPPVPAQLKLLGNTYKTVKGDPDLYSLCTRGQEEVPLVWNPKGETRSHVRLGNLVASTVPGLNHRLRVTESTERTWARSIHRAWDTLNPDGDGYFSLPSLRGLRFVDDADNNAKIVAQLTGTAKKLIALSTKEGVTCDELIFPSFDYFDVVMQTHDVVVDDLDAEGNPLPHAPESQQVDGGDVGDPNIIGVIKQTRDNDEFPSTFRVQLQVSINDPLGDERTKQPSTQEALRFFQLYFNLLLASFVRDAFSDSFDDGDTK